MNGSKPLSADEYVLRRISAFNVIDRFHYSSFIPSSSDTDGLSLWRETANTPDQLVDGAKSKYGYYVVKFRVQELTDLGFILEPTDQIAPGHVSIVNLKPENYKTDKARVTETLERLAELAWNRRVLGPTPPLI
jgi:hypothetical protein